MLNSVNPWLVLIVGALIGFYAAGQMVDRQRRTS